MRATTSNYVVIYIKAGFCPKCKATLKRLDQLGIKTVQKTVEVDDTITINLLKKHGVQQFPYVEVVDGAGQLLDTWSDYRIDKIDSWFK